VRRLATVCSVALILCSCSTTRDEDRPAPASSLADAVSAPPSPAPHGYDAAPERPERLEDAAAATNDEPQSPPAAPSYESSIDALREAGYAKAAKVLTSRVDQLEKKHKLTKEQATEAAVAMVKLLPKMANTTQLLERLPRCTVELVRAVDERGVPMAEAERIAEFHLTYTKAAGLSRLDLFDEAHSHIIGRDFSQIDYTGEGTTWQQRQASWAKVGVENFKTASSICRYFRAESKMGYHKRLFNPKRSFPHEVEERFCE